jgi:hypothetical protein
MKCTEAPGAAPRRRAALRWRTPNAPCPVKHVGARRFLVARSIGSRVLKRRDIINSAPPGFLRLVGTRTHGPRQSHHNAMNPSPQLDHGRGTSAEGPTLGAPAESRHLRPREKQRYGHDHCHRQKLNEEEHKGNLNEQFHADLPRQPRCAITRLRRTSQPTC